MNLPFTAFITALISLTLSITAHAQPLKSTLLRTAAAAISEDQYESLRILGGALERLRTTYNAQPSTLSKAFEEWSKTYNSFADHTVAAQTRVNNFKKIANDLFVEWKQEAETISDRSLRRRSQSKLEDAKDHYEDLVEQLTERSEAQAKVLQQLKDRVLFIKHNLNAQSLAVLDDQAAEIRDEIEQLTQEIKDALPKIDSFIQTL